MTPRNIILRCPRGKPFELSKGDDPLVYRKEVAYPGRFVKPNDNGGVEFELPIDETLIDHYVATFSRMKANGIDVPVPVGHTTDPEKRRGTVINMTKEPDPDHGIGLFAYVKFRDEAAAKQFKDSQVSLFQPPQMVDGKGNKYTRPITHVAITDYPVVPDLGPFQPIAASFELSLDVELENTSMTFAELATELGVEVPEGAGDDEIAQAIIAAWNTEETPAGEEPPADAGGEPAPLSDPPAIPVAASLVRQVAKARKTELDQLCRDKKISPAVRDQLVKKYTTEQHMTVSLSRETAGEASDDFDDLVAALSLNEPMFSTGERTGAQHHKNQGKSPVVADAEKRAAARSKK